MTAATALALDPRDELFRCEKYACTLRKGACLARRAERWTKRGRGRGYDGQQGRAFEKTGAIYPFCATECEQGETLSAELGAAPERVRRATPVRLPPSRVHVVPAPAPAPASPTPEVAPVAVTKPEHVAASRAAVMIEKKCKCGCGRPLRKNNESGYSGYCNAAKFAAGTRERPSRAKARDVPDKEILARPLPNPPAPADPSLPPVEDLPEPYLAACVREARRRLACAKVLEEALAS
jgi:hypothetical protein